MAARRPFLKWCRWKSIGFCLWPPSTCIWSLKLIFESKLDLCSGNNVVYRQTDGQTDGRTRWIQYNPPPTSGIKINEANSMELHLFCNRTLLQSCYVLTNQKNLHYVECSIYHMEPKLLSHAPILVWSLKLGRQQSWVLRRDQSECPPFTSNASNDKSMA